MRTKKIFTEGLYDVSFAENASTGEMFHVAPIWKDEKLATLYDKDDNKKRILIGDLYNDYNLYDINNKLIHEASLEEGYSDESRKHTNKLLELVEDGVLDKDGVIMCLVKWMSDEDVGECCKANEIELFDIEDECLTESDEDVYTSKDGRKLAHTGQGYGVFSRDNVFMGRVDGDNDKDAIANMEAGNLVKESKDDFGDFTDDVNFDELDRLYTDMWHQDDFDPVEDDEEHANLYGGDRTFCSECGEKLSHNDRGSYCPNCEPWEAFDNENDNW